MMLISNKIIEKGIGTPIEKEIDYLSYFSFMLEFSIILCGICY